MIRGTATLDLNEATLIEAVQEYLDKRWMPEARSVVKSVKSASEGQGYGSNPVFRVTLTEAESAVQAKP